MTTTVNDADVDALLAKLGRLEEEIAGVIVGQKEAVRHLVLALLAGGHVLLEGVPGLAKTLMVRTLAQALELSFKRIQMTPDLMPSDVVGTEILERGADARRRFRFQRGPIFANLVLADEVNRSPPKTQSALLEAMQEQAVTYGGETFPLPRPFFVLATQNPIEQTGTYPLPEAQRDRFLLHLLIDYPSAEEEEAMAGATTGDWRPEVTAVLDGAELLAAQALVRQVHVSSALVRYAVRLVRASRPAETAIDAVRRAVEWGAGPRAAQAMLLAAKARALIAGRFAVALDDLRAVALPVLRHRLVLSFRGQADGVRPDDVAGALLAEVAEPRSPLADA
ncbi:MAG: MoxR family ATPase [Acidobacteria bacterium]|nr:MAG: MoxR family ATPase [Acidobacteriota bacterium]